MKATIGFSPGTGYGSEDGQPNRAVGQDVGDAAYNTVHNYPGGVAALAVRLGMSANTLAHKVNPHNTTHHLTLREAVAIQQLSGNVTILHAMADALGHAATPIAADQSGGDPIDTLMRLQCEVADFVRAVADAVRTDGQYVSSNQIRRADWHAQELSAAIGHTLSMLRGRMRPSPKSES